MILVLTRLPVDSKVVLRTPALENSTSLPPGVDEDLSSIYDLMGHLN